jgi:TonB-linked SusC/RagA family outer membrane protein
MKNEKYLNKKIPFNGYKFSKIMRLTIFLSIIFTWSAAANVFSQEIHFDNHSRQFSVKEVLKTIERQTDYTFFYNDAFIDLNRFVTVDKSDVEVGELLAAVFKETDLTYREHDNRFIVLTPKSMVQEIIVSGTVTDANGESLPGVNIRVKGTGTGTATDINGKYSIAVPDRSATLVFSCVGFISREVVVGSQTSISITLEEDTKLLEEVVVLGYGATTRKSDLSAAIGIVANMEALKKRPITSTGALLQGQIPGVTVRSDGGDPTDGEMITIRGKGSNGTENVLWVVDGVPGGPLHFNDIESVVVLKDAASAAIYGAHAGAAGVILVTTKKAKAGKTTVSYDGSFGYSEATNLPQSLTIEEERQVRTAAYAAGGGTLPTGWDVSRNPYIGETRTDWIDAISRKGLLQRHNLTLSGGNEAMTNRLSLQYQNKEGTLISTFNKSIGMIYEGSYTLNKYIRIRETFNWGTGQSRGANTDDQNGVIYNAIMMPRNAEVYYPDGTYGGTAPKDPAYEAQYGSNFADIHGDVINPVRSLASQSQFRKPLNIGTSTFLEILDPIPGLKFTSRFTYNQSSSFDKDFNYKRLEVGKPDAGNSLQYRSGVGWSWETENRLNYDRDFGEHRVGALVATTANKSRGRSFNTSNSMFEDEDPNYQYLSYGTSSMGQGDGYSSDNNVSFVGMLSYSWNNRYFATASFRRDYAGRLPAGKKYGDFPSATAAWKISEESFFPKSDAWSLLKLRGSWGRIGNLGSIGANYAFPVLTKDYSATAMGENGLPYENFIYYSAAFNSLLTWETSEQTDFGVDLEFLGNRLSFSADYFDKRTFNLIKRQDAGWPTYIGVTPKLINEGEIHNTGFEFTAGWKDRIGQVDYYINGNLSTLKNRVSDIGPVDPETGKKPVWRYDDNYRVILQPMQTIEGEPLYSYWLIKSDGLFQSDAEAAAYVDKEGNRIQPYAVAGDIKFIDQNGDGKINDDDRIYMGGYFPKITYALMGGVTWKNLSFSLMLQGVGGSKAFYAAKYHLLNEGIGNFNRWNKILDAYPNTNDIPRLTTVDSNGNFGTQSDWYLEDASYLRIKNINIGYAFDRILPASLRQRNGSLQVYLSVDNLYTFTKYSGMNPEIEDKGLDQGKYPVPRVVALGVSIVY